MCNRMFYRAFCPQPKKLETISTNFNDSNNRPRDLCSSLLARPWRELKERHSRSQRHYFARDASGAKRAPRHRPSRKRGSQRTRFSILFLHHPFSLLSPPSLSYRVRWNEVERISQSVCESLAVGPLRRRPLPPPRQPIAVDCAGGGCLAIVTLALLIACPTKVYHYHRHPSWPAQRTESPSFRVICIQYSSPSGVLLPFPPLPITPLFLSLVLSLYAFSIPLSISHLGYTRISGIRFRTRPVLPWKLSPALFELFATVLIRFIAAAATAGRDRRFGFSFTTQLSPGYTCRGREITRYPRRTRIYIASNHSPTD